jgi:hypothetical protein
MKKTLYLPVILIFLLLAACGRDPGGSALPTLAVPTSATAGEATPTSASVAQATVISSPTSGGPAATSTLPAAPATPTAVPTATALPSPTVTATPTAVLLLTVEDFGDNRNPLTGELVEDPTILDRRPVAVKISNSPPSFVRPQSGLSQADIVYEHVAEGAVTRFTAILYSQTPPDVGPIRSARLIDHEIPAMYDSALAYSGASIGVNQILNRSDFNDRLLRDGSNGFYRTGADKPWEHTLYANPEGFWESLDEAGQNQAPTFNTYMAFGSETPAGGQPASAVHITYRSFGTVEWRYDAESGRYLRWADDVPHLDANTDEQISAANVVVVFAVHNLDMNICEFVQNNVCQSYSVITEIWEQGDAIIFRDGVYYEATWVREERGDMLTFQDDEGDPIPLQIGNTFIQIVPYHYTDPVTITP